MSEAPKMTTENPEANNERGELSKKARELYRSIGGDTNRVILTNVELDEKAKKRDINNLVLDAVNSDDENRRAEFEKKHATLAKIGKKRIVKVVTAIPAGIANTIRRSVAIRGYRNIANEVVNETGKLSAASIAVEQLRKTKSFNDSMLNDRERENGFGKKEDIVERVKENIGKIYDTTIDDAIKERAEEAINAGEDNMDFGVKLEENVEEKAAISEALTAYATKIAGLKNNKKARQELSDAKRQLSEEFKKAGIEMKEYKDTINEMTDSLRGKLSKELSKNEKTEEHKAALEAIDEYIAKNVEVIDAKVDTGLVVKKRKGSTADEAALNLGIAAGIIIGIGGTCLGYTKNGVINAITNSSIVGTVAKIGLAGTIGAAKGYANKKRAQINKNVDNALNIDSDKTNINESKEFSVISVDKKIAEMQLIKKINGKFMRERTNDKGVYDSISNKDVIELIAELRTRNELQNKNSVQLLGYNGRENVEKNKLEMFKQINRLQRELMAGLSPEEQADIKDALEDKIKNRRAELSEQINNVKSEQGKERRRAALKTGLIAAGTAGVMSFVSDYVHGAIKNGKLWSTDNSKLLSEIGGLSSGKLKFQGLHVVDASELAGATAAAAVAEDAANVVDNAAESKEILKEYKGALIINDDINGGSEIGFDVDGDGKIDTFLHGEGSEPGLDLTDENVYNDLSAELSEYGIELKREAIESSAYNEMSIGDYLNGQENTVEVNGVDWSQSATKVAFGKPTVVVGDGIDQYEVAIRGIGGESIPDGAKFFIDLDGDGPGQALEFSIEDGKAIIPSDILDTSAVGNGGVANFIGTARVGQLGDDGTMISYATAFGKGANLDSTISANVTDNAYAFTALNVDGEKISQFAVNASGDEISNMSEIFNGIEVGDSDRLPSTFTVHDIDGNDSTIELASGESFGDYDVSGGYHPEFDAFENKPFFANNSNSYLGTPMTWDTNGDGIMDSAEELSYIKQMLVRTGTNPFMLAQNASNYGILEPERLRSLFASDYEYSKFLDACGIEGVIDSEAELNAMIEVLKANPEYWDKIANETINEMEKQLQGGGFELSTITGRVSTYANNYGDFDTSSASTQRYILYPYHVDGDGNKVYVGNQGWWCRKYGAEGGKVGDLPLCEQKGISRKVSSEKTSNEKTGSEKISNEKTSDEKTGSEKTAGEKTSNEKTGSEKTTDEKTVDEKTSVEKVTNEKTSDEKTSDEGIAPKGPDTNAGGDVDQQPVTPVDNTNYDYVEPTPENHVTPEPGSSSDANPDSGNPEDINLSNDDLKETYEEIRAGDMEAQFNQF